MMSLKLSYVRESSFGVGVNVGRALLALRERPSRVGVVDIGGRRLMKA